MVANISPYFIGAFITPLVLMLVVNMLLMLSPVVDATFELYDDAEESARVFAAVRQTQIARHELLRRRRRRRWLPLLTRCRGAAVCSCGRRARASSGG